MFGRTSFAHAYCATTADHASGVFVASCISALPFSASVVQLRACSGQRQAIQVNSAVSADYHYFTPAAQRQMPLFSSSVRAAIVRPLRNPRACDRAQDSFTITRMLPGFVAFVPCPVIGDAHATNSPRNVGTPVRPAALMHYVLPHERIHYDQKWDQSRQWRCPGFRWSVNSVVTASVETSVPGETPADRTI